MEATNRSGGRFYVLKSSVVGFPDSLEASYRRCARPGICSSRGCWQRKLTFGYGSPIELEELYRTVQQRVDGVHTWNVQVYSTAAFAALREFPSDLNHLRPDS